MNQNLQSQEIPMGLVERKIYPDYYSYRGKAFEGNLVFHTIRLEFLNDAIEWVATEVLEYAVNSKNGKMLDLSIYLEEDWWGIIPTYRWTLKWNFYIPGVSLGQATAGAGIILALIISLLGLIAIYFVLQQVKEIIWGPTNGNGDGIIPDLTTLLIVGGVVALGFVLLIPKK